MASLLELMKRYAVQWPVGATYVVQDSSRQLRFYKGSGRPETISAGSWDIRLDISQPVTEIKHIYLFLLMIGVNAS